jgi:ribosome-binding factor A
MSYKPEKLISLLGQLSAEYLNRKMAVGTLITVTNCTVSDDFKRATILITVLPEDREEEVLAAAKRERSDLREFIRSKADLGTLPFLEIEIDRGEKARRRIDDLIDKG